METEGAAGICQEPTSFYLLGVALRSFFLVLATHLLAGEVDTTLACAPFRHRLSWWFRYYNPLNLSWRYYSMFAYRFTAHSWGTQQLALINHEEHPFLPPLPYIVGETVHPLRVRRLEMAGLLSSQGILTFSAAYQGALAIQYAISTEGIPYLPNTTVPLAMVGLFRVMASKWVASKIQVDSYPYPGLPSSDASQDSPASRLWPCALTSKSNTDPALASSHTGSSSKDPLSTYLHSIRSSLSIVKSHRQPSLTSPSPSLTSSPIISSDAEPSSSLVPFSTQSNRKLLSFSPINLPYSQPPLLLLPSFPYTACPPSPLRYSPSSSPQSHVSSLLPTLSRPYSHLASPPLALGSLPSANECLAATESSPQTHPVSLSHSRPLPSQVLSSDTSKATALAFPSSSSCKKSSTFITPCSACAACVCTCTALPSSLPSVACQVHPLSSAYNQPLDYKSNKFVVTVWIGVLLGLVTMSFLPYKVAAAYQLPHKFLPFSMQLFYQYIAVSEFTFHAFLLYQGPRALANRVLFFDHWTFKAQTVGFYCLLTFMLVIALIDFVKHGYYRDCA